MTICWDVLGIVRPHMGKVTGEVDYGARHLVTATFVQTPMWWESVVRGVSGGGQQSTCGDLLKQYSITTTTRLPD